MTGTPHDALFKAAFEQPAHAGGLFRSVLPAQLCAAIAWDTLTREAGSFIDPDLASRHSDLLFSVELCNEQSNKQAFLYLLLEHQSTNDGDMLLRMFMYLGRIWERYRKDTKGGPLPLVLPFVISHSVSGWTAPRCFHELFDPDPGSIPGLAPYVPSFSLLLDDLTELDDQALKARALAAFPTLALWLLRDARDARDGRDGRDGRVFWQSLVDWVGAFRAAYRAPHGTQAVAQLFRYIALVVGDVQFDHFRAMIREAVPEAEEVAMTIAEQLRQEGHQQGHQQGLQQGRADMLAKLMAAKFGAPSGELPPTYTAQLAAATEEQLQRYMDRFLTASTLEAVFADLN